MKHGTREDPRDAHTSINYEYCWNTPFMIKDIKRLLFWLYVCPIKQVPALNITDIHVCTPTYEFSFY